MQNLRLKLIGLKVFKKFRDKLETLIDKRYQRRRGKSKRGGIFPTNTLQISDRILTDSPS